MKGERRNRKKSAGLREGEREGGRDGKGGGDCTAVEFMNSQLDLIKSIFKY